MLVPLLPRSARFTSALLILLGMQAGVQALEPVESLLPDIDAELIDTTIEQLGDPSWKVRESARQRLVEIGPDVLPRLDAARQNPASVHLAQVLDVTGETIRRAWAGRETRIWLNLDQAPAGDALRELCSRSDTTLHLGDIDTETPVSNRFEGISWWEAMRHLCHENDWDLRVTAMGMSMIPSTSSRTLGGPITVSGPMLLAAREASVSRHLRFDRSVAINPSNISQRDERREMFVYEFEGYLEPRFAIGSRRFRVLWTSAIADEGTDGEQVLLEPMDGGIADLAGMAGDVLAGLPTQWGNAQSPGHYADAEFTAGRLRFRGSFKTPEAGAESITLQGRIRGRVGGDITAAEATTTAMERGLRWRIADEQVEVRFGPGRSPGRWQATFETFRDSGPETAELIAASLAGAELKDQAGQTLRRGPAHRTTNEAGGIVYKVEFISPDTESPLIPAMLTCDVPQRLVELDLPFIFEGLPVP